MRCVQQEFSKEHALCLVSHVHFLSPMRYHRFIKFPLYGLSSAPALGSDCRTPIAPIRSPIRSRSTSQNFSAERRSRSGASTSAASSRSLGWRCDGRERLFDFRIICAFYTSIWGTLRITELEIPGSGILVMTFPNAARPSSFADGSGFAAQPCGLAEQQGVAYAKTVAEAMNVKGAAMLR